MFLNLSRFGIPANYAVNVNPFFAPLDRATICLQRIVHVLLGYRELRDAVHYQDDPLVQRLLGPRCLPDVATISRMLWEADQKSVDKLRQLLSDLVLERLRSLPLARLTLDIEHRITCEIRSTS